MKNCISLPILNGMILCYLNITMLEGVVMDELLVSPLLVVFFAFPVIKIILQCTMSCIIM